MPERNPDVTDLGQSPVLWGAEVDYDLWNDTPIAKDKVVFHWMGDWSSNWSALTGAQLMWLVESWHLGKRWRGFAYGWGIDATTGELFRARGMNWYGAHLGDLDGDGIPANQEAIPVLFLTGVGGPSLSTAAKLTAASLVSELAKRTGRSRLATYGHRDIQLLGSGTKTQCPGDSIHQYAESLRLGTLPPTKADAVQYLTLKLYTTSAGKPTYVRYTTNGQLRLHARHAQSMLANLDYGASNTFNAKHQPDGLFGPGTKLQVERFQRDRGLTSDGVVGPLTWLELTELQ